MKSIFGIDVGGTSVKLGMFSAAGDVLEKWEIPTRKENGGKKILPDIAKSLVNKIKAKGADEVAGVGIGLPGPVDSAGIIRKAVNLNWDGTFSVPDALAKALAEAGMENASVLTIKASNDANVAALGETWKGGGQGYRDLIMVTLGTGIGGGVILDGKIWDGPVGSAGEIGHMHMEDEETLQCTCGNYGCLEQYASATGIVRLAERYVDTHEPEGGFKKLMEHLVQEYPEYKRKNFRQIVEGLKPFSAKMLFDLVRLEDPQAKIIAETFGQKLGKGLAAAACVVNPEAFVIGGGVSKAGELLFDYIVPYYKKYAFHACGNADFKLATLGNDAGIYGAAKLVLA